MLIPAASLNKLTRLVSNKDELNVGTTGKCVVFMKEDFLFSARLMEGEHIDDEMLLQSVRSAFTILTDASALYEAVSSVSVAAEEGDALSLLFRDNQIRVCCEGKHCASSQELEVVALSGTPEGEYWYSPGQLSQCLAALSGTLILEVGQNGVLVMRTDNLVCLQLSRRKPILLRTKEENQQKKAARPAA